MWPFRKKDKATPGIAANSVEIIDGVAIVDVHGQTCPGYLLAINKAVDSLEQGMKAKLLISYPPCGDDVKAWCNERKIQYLGMTQEPGKWIIEIHK